MNKTMNKTSEYEDKTNEMNSSINESVREAASLTSVGPNPALDQRWTRAKDHILSNNKSTADESGCISEDLSDDNDQLAYASFSGNDDPKEAVGNTTRRMLFGIRCHILAFRGTKRQKKSDKKL